MSAENLPADKLTDEEISALNWTQKILLAQNKISIADARALVADRAKKKKVKSPSLTEQCLAVTGGKDQVHRTR